MEWGRTKTPLLSSGGEMSLITFVCGTLGPNSFEMPTNIDEVYLQWLPAKLASTPQIELFVLWMRCLPCLVFKRNPESLLCTSGSHVTINHMLKALRKDLMYLKLWLSIFCMDHLQTGWVFHKRVGNKCFLLCPWSLGGMNTLTCLAVAMIQRSPMLCCRRFFSPLEVKVSLPSLPHCTRPCELETGLPVVCPRQHPYKDAF